MMILNRVDNYCQIIAKCNCDQYFEQQIKWTLLFQSFPIIYDFQETLHSVQFFINISHHSVSKALKRVFKFDGVFKIHSYKIGSSVLQQKAKNKHDNFILVKAL